jgi:hypothetical protein
MSVLERGGIVVKNNFMWAFIENIFLFILIGFLCWLFKSGWPILLIVFANYVRTKNNDKKED